MRSANSNADSKPQIGSANDDIASFANTNTIGKYTGEPIGELNLGRQLDGETKSGLVLGRPYTHVTDDGTEEELKERFTTVNLEDKHPRGSNTIGGQLGDIISMNSDQFETPVSASGKSDRSFDRESIGSRSNLERESQGNTSQLERDSQASRTNVSGGQNLRGEGAYQPRGGNTSVSSDLNASRTTLDTQSNKDQRLVFDSVRPIENREGDGVHVGGNEENRKTHNWDNDLSCQMVGGPGPGRGLAGAGGRLDVPYDVTNQMYYSENTGNVKSTDKLGQSKHNGQAPLEGYDTTNEAVMKGVYQESEEHALKYAPKESFRKEGAGTTWAT